MMGMRKMLFDKKSRRKYFLEKLKDEKELLEIEREIKSMRIKIKKEKEQMGLEGFKDRVIRRVKRKQK